MKLIIALAGATLLSSLPITPAVAQQTPKKDIFCYEYYPDATYEDLLFLCEGNVPPGGGSGGPYTTGGTSPVYPGKHCDYVTRAPGGGPGVCHAN